MSLVSGSTATLQKSNRFSTSPSTRTETVCSSSRHQKIRMQAPLEQGSMTAHHLASQGIESVDDWNARLAQRTAEKEETNRIVLSPDTPGEDKMHAQCKYIFKYRKTMFSCPHCWLLPGLCLCSRLAKVTTQCKMVVHVHFLEWGKASNTGSVIGVAVNDCEVLMKGLKEHDVRMKELFQDKSVTTAVLWPGDNSITPSELKKIAEERSEGRIAVIAVDATWGNALRMKTSYPPDTLYVKLTPESAIISEQQRSLLAPVRKYRGDYENNARVSTLEAVASLLYELEGSNETRQALLGNLKMKVDTCLIQKNRNTVYGTLTAEDFLQKKVEAVVMCS
ncbi:hypothetical protein CEUSTIGMA_g8650.t1 [Chlamydomonas eustigma]|uniref:tRNA-uridine aminocarboxypropyltransferase n=1 Tax=Chlamydomonas eustigma TaxID=1157962 RepID=A0A250XDQ3_9CHLO|nr:hypothetical protein CEUSTIGMA_g8650.t1 [Chlamydomonas eustigma]|eukprot:GAX81218.1 hypothetical protein CEUSTIGMA_g8650.t1 [Chlamydomonas eustigma]